RVWAEYTVRAAGPDDRHLLDLLGGCTLLDQHLAESTVGDDPGIVVDSPVALGLADDRDHPLRGHDAVVDELRELGSIGDGVDRDLANLDGIRHGSSSQLFGTTTVP